MKAAYLLNFTRYVEWPAAAFDSANAPIEMCVVGDDPFGDILDATARGRSARGRRIVVRRAARAADTAGCHVAFISATSERSTRRALASTRRPVLTVGEGSRFASSEGGMVSLVIVDETVRFEVNLEATRRAGLGVSSRVLSLAHRVHGTTGDSR